MQTNVFHVWANRTATFALAALAALSGTYWFLKSTDANSVPTAPPAAGTSFAALDPQSVARALGGGNAGAPAPGSPSTSAGRTPFVLVGVLADRQRGGAALIAVDGKAAKPYRVGATVDGSLVLQSVSGRTAALGTAVDGPAQFTLELPPLSR
jgi:general secretion pathway protein C